MKQKQIFELAVRILGLVCIIPALSYAIRAVHTLMIGFSTSVGFTQELVSAVGMAMLAVYFLRGAPLFVRIAYPADDGAPH